MENTERARGFASGKTTTPAFAKRTRALQVTAAASDQYWDGRRRWLSSIASSLV